MPNSKIIERKHWAKSKTSRAEQGMGLDDVGLAGRSESDDEIGDVQRRASMNIGPCRFGPRELWKGNYARSRGSRCTYFELQATLPNHLPVLFFVRTATTLVMQVASRIISSISALMA